jgi:poly-gamma-glutamate capsule biosynthesis protein CapA/YwtB (metallophosphatase superfamily)
MEADSGTITLLLAGDVMTGRGIDQVLAHPASPELYEEWMRDARGYVRLAEQANGPIPAPVTGRYLWGEALEAMKRAGPHACIVNLETAITASGRPWPGKGIHYRMHPANIACLKAGGVKACALANNHTLDWREAGLVDTLATLANAGLPAAGAGLDLEQATTPAVLPSNHGRRLLVFSWAAPDCGVPDGWNATPDRPGIAVLRDLAASGLEQIADAVHRHRRENDLVLLSIHWGANWVDAVPQRHRRFARELIDRHLVDIVHGHSAHHPLPFEVHQGKLVLFGCGDLINDYEGIGAEPGYPMDIACLYAATLSQDSGRLLRLRIVPLQRRAFRLVRADPAARASIRHALRLKENGFARQLRFEPEGDWLIEPQAARIGHLRRRPA